MDSSSKYQEPFIEACEMISLMNFMEDDGWLSIQNVKDETGFSEDVVVKLVITNYMRGKIIVQDSLGIDFKFRLVSDND